VGVIHPIWFSYFENWNGASFYHYLCLPHKKTIFALKMENPFYIETWKLTLVMMFATAIYNFLQEMNKLS
jgi:hypothetical protein